MFGGMEIKTMLECKQILDCFAVIMKFVVFEKHCGANVLKSWISISVSESAVLKEI